MFRVIGEWWIFIKSLGVEFRVICKINFLSNSTLKTPCVPVMSVIIELVGHSYEIIETNDLVPKDKTTRRYGLVGKVPFSAVPTK